uniref:polycomb group protein VERNALIZATION 2-like n=1 Tax=Erigeron canadensis TaxID=72917 RepID=UPI001CB8E8CA|nr:polycomb group protein VERNALIZATION 2-like [Erigeron canadensis]
MDSWNKNSVIACSYSRDSEVHVPLSEEEQVEADESFSVYVRPIELYDILVHRARQNTSFLQRCLHYKFLEKHKRRVRLSISVSRHNGDGLQTESLFPFYILLARPVPGPNVETSRSSCYRFNQPWKITVINGAQTESSTQAKLILPEISTLSTEVKSGSITMLLMSYVDNANQKEIDLTNYEKLSYTHDGYCLLGKIPLDFLHSSLNEYGTISLGEKVQTSSLVTMHSCFMKSIYIVEDKEKYISFHFSHNSEAVSILQQVPVLISAEHCLQNISPYDLYSYKSIPPGLLSDFIRLRSGNVIFYYRYYKNLMHRSEVTEDYSCPFCLIKGGNYKGLTCHLITSHDLFSYDFRVNKDYQVVIVSVESDTWTSEIIGSTSPRIDTFFFCHHRPSKHRKPSRKKLNAILCDLRGVSEHVECDTQSPNAPYVSNDAVTTFCGPETDTQLVPPVKTRNLSAERSYPRNQVLLRKHHFYHSHRAQPMALEQVLADEDSEDEVDDDVTDLEDRTMLDDFVDIDQDEKQLMHLWNSFARKQRLLADAHVSWACKAFSDFHGKYLVETPPLGWCWNFFLVKLYNHSLLDSKTVDKCHLILNKYHPQNKRDLQQIDPDKTKVDAV